MSILLTINFSVLVQPQLITTAVDKSFKLVKLSGKRRRDKLWVMPTCAVKKNSQIKN